MTSLRLPENVQIQIVDNKLQPSKIENVLVYVHLFARHKNDFYLGPYYSDNNGIINITKNDLNNEIEATYSTGLMDYLSVDNCFPMIEIKTYTADEINKQIYSRENVWKTLLKGESNRWKNMNELILLFKSASNLKLVLKSSSIRDEWLEDKKSYSYKLTVVL